MTTPTLTLSRVDSRTWTITLDLGGRTVSLPFDKDTKPVDLARSVCTLIAESGVVRVHVDTGCTIVETSKPGQHLPLTPVTTATLGGFAESVGVCIGTTISIPWSGDHWVITSVRSST